MNYDGEQRAYPISVVVRFEIVSDHIGEKYYSSVYWPLVDLAAVYSWEIDDQVLTLSASGWVYITKFVLYDYETESIWFPFDEDGNLTCIGGTYFGLELPILNYTRTTWSNWVSRYPNTKFLVY